MYGLSVWCRYKRPLVLNPNADFEFETREIGEFWSWNSLGYILSRHFFAMSAMFILKCDARSAMKTQTDKIYLVRFGCAVVRSPDETHTTFTFTWHEDGCKGMWNAENGMRHAITFVYLIFDQFILIKSSLDEQLRLSSTWHFVSIKFYFYFFALHLLCSAHNFCYCWRTVDICEWWNPEKRRQQRRCWRLYSNKRLRNDNRTEQTEHFYFARRHLLNVCSDSHSIIIIIWNQFVLSSIDRSENGRNGEEGKIR